MSDKLKSLFEKYVSLCEKNDVVACGDLASEQDDETCKALYELLIKDDRTKDKLVKTLWYNYNEQRMRWN